MRIRNRWLALAVLAACGSNPPPAAAPRTDDHAAHDHAHGDMGSGDHGDHMAHHDHDHGAMHGDHGAHAEGATHDHATMGAMPHRFERAEEWAPRFDDPARDAWQRPDDIVALMGIKPGMTVADVGAGTGYLESRLSAAVGAKGAVIATDVEPDMVRYMTERAHKSGWANVTAQLGGADDPKLAAASVDRIVILDVWHHIGDRVAFARGLASALKPGGQVVIVDFELSSDRGPPKEHRLAPSAIQADLTAAGLTATLATESLPDQYVVVGTRR